MIAAGAACVVVREVCLLAICVAQYPTLKESWADICFEQQGWILLAGFAAVLAPLVWRGGFANRRA